MVQPLSVIVVNRNTAHLLEDCLNRIFRSELDDDPEVIMVDNGSTDYSVQLVREKFPRVRIIEAGRNLGFAAANNRAASVARGEFLLLVNTDALLEPDCAGRLLRLMRGNQSIGMAGPQLLNADGTHQTSYEAIPTLATETLNRSLLKRLFPARYPGKHSRLTSASEVPSLIGAVMMIRKRALKELGGFDEDYFFFLEETDLALRMSKQGWQVVHEPSAAATHLQGATAAAYPAAARIEFYRSRYIFFRKHYGAAAERALKAVLTANLTASVPALGLACLATLGCFTRLTARFRSRARLWLWHLRGRPEGQGLPRE